MGEVGAVTPVDPTGLAEIGRELRAIGNRLVELRAGLIAARPDGGVWKGVAAEQARAVHDALLAGLGRWVSGIETAVAVFNAAADDLAELVDVLRRCDTMAAEHGYVITDDGMVAAAGEDSRTDTTAGREEDEAAVVQLRAGVASVVQRATDIDTRLRSGLHELLTALPRPADMPQSAAPEPQTGWSTLVGLRAGRLDRIPSAGSRDPVGAIVAAAQLVPAAAAGRLRVARAMAVAVTTVTGPAKPPAAAALAAMPGVAVAGMAFPSRRPRPRVGRVDAAPGPGPVATPRYGEDPCAENDQDRLPHSIRQRRGACGCREPGHVMRQ